MVSVYTHVQVRLSLLAQQLVCWSVALRLVQAHGVALQPRQTTYEGVLVLHRLPADTVLVTFH